MDNIQLATLYFRQNPVWKKVFEGFRKKYISYDSFSGTVVLRGLKQSEIEELEGFFGKSFHGQKSVSISAEKFQKALNQTRFAPVKATSVIEYYLGETLIGKKSQKIAIEEERQRILKEASKTYVMFMNKSEMSGSGRSLLFRETQENQTGQIEVEIAELGDWIWDCRSKEIKEWERQLYLSIRILQMLPIRMESTRYLAVFAAEVTGNPHAFDRGTADGELLEQLLQKWCRKTDTGEDTEGIENQVFLALKRQKRYLEAGILPDAVSNYCMISGVRAWKRNGSAHAGMNGFCQEGDSVQVPLSVLAKWGRIDCPNKVLYIVENPSIFAALCEETKGRCACMCMNGQPRLASIVLLDLAAEAGIKILYAGDFDPEGLLIAQKVVQYYKGEAEYWHMTVDDYKQSISEEKISDKRIAMLERITDERLKGVAEKIRELGVAGYQERLVEKYVGDTR